jgi:UDP-GlcNAc:undecaprenyl-phosphate GlcNAc-1-phosphate transferase
MGEYVLTLLAAAAVTYLLTPAVRRLAIAVGAVHAPRDRDVHVVPTPLLGGFAMYAGLATGLLVASRIPALTGAFAEPNMAKGLLLAGGLVVIMGFIDDRWGLGALSKLAGQVAAGVILVWSGAEVTWIPLPGGGTLGLTTDQQTAATILVVVVTINAVNFIDGLDGLATGIVGIGAAAFFVYYYTLTHRLGLPDQTGPALASAVLVGICLGFLPHNFYPARIFMGDTGAMLLGLLLAFAPISSSASLDPASLTDSAAYHAGTVNRFGAIVPLLLPAAILLIPYADLLMAVVRRTRAGTSPFSADKKHLHHRLLAIGHSHKTSVLLMYLWAALFAGCVAWLSIVRTSLYVLIIVTGAMMLALALLLVSMPRLRPWVRAAGRQGAATVVPQASPAEVRPAWAASGQDAVAWQAAGTAASAGVSGRTGNLTGPAPPVSPPPVPSARRAAPAGSPAAAENRTTPVPTGPEATGPVPAAPAGFPAAAENHTAPVPADLQATGPVPAAPWPLSSGPPSASGSAPGAPPQPPFARGPEPGPAPEAPAGPSFGRVPEPGRVARQPIEPPAEPAPWPGFAQDEPPGSAPPSAAVPGPAGGPVAGRTPVPPAGPAAERTPVPPAIRATEPTPVPPTGPAGEPRSWFEPAQPATSGHPNGSAAPAESGRFGDDAASPGSRHPNSSAAPAESGRFGDDAASPGSRHPNSSATAPESGAPAESGRFGDDAASPGSGHPNGSAAPAESGRFGGATASPGSGRPNGSAASARPGEPDGDEPVPDQWSAPSFPRVDPRLPASLQDRR